MVELVIYKDVRNITKYTKARWGRDLYCSKEMTPERNSNPEEMSNTKNVNIKDSIDEFFFLLLIPLKDIGSN